MTSALQVWKYIYIGAVFSFVSNKPLIYCCDSVTEICSVANGASKKEIGRAKEFIVKHLEEEMGKSMEMGTIHAGDFLVYFLLFFSLKEKIVTIFFLIQ